MVENTGNLSKHRANPFCSLRNLNVQQLLDSQGVNLLVGHHRDVIQSVEVRQRLHIRLVLNQFLGSTMQKTDVRICANDFLAIKLQDQPQHTVSRRMLGAEIDGVVANLAVPCIRGRLHARSDFWSFGAAFVRLVGEDRIGGNETGWLIGRWLRGIARG